MTGILIVVLIVVAAVLYAQSRRSIESTGDERGLPAELRGARLAHAEETFRSEAQRVVARLDRAYELAGELVLVEFKTRSASVAYRDDIIELSVQRVALQDERKVPVSRVAWVITQDSATGRRTPHRVTLLDTAEVQALRTRYLAIEAGIEPDPRPARSMNQCLHCGHRAVCHGR